MITTKSENVCALENDTCQSTIFVELGKQTILCENAVVEQTEFNHDNSHSKADANQSKQQKVSMCKKNDEIKNNNVDTKRKPADKNQISSSLTNLLQSSYLLPLEQPKSNTKISERVKRKSWYNAIYPSYKSRSQTFKKLFSDVPSNERLIADYSCAVQREILAHGRMFVTSHHLCFHANIFGWETFLNFKWKDITALTKEKTALVIPNAILVSTETEKYFITSFAARDKTYLLLFRIWQNALLNRPMLPKEIWQCVHNLYGDQLGLTSDDEDYIDPNDIEIKSIQPNVPIEKPDKAKHFSIIDSDKTAENEFTTSDKILECASTTNNNSKDSRNFVRALPYSKLRLRKIEMIGSNDNNLPTDLSDSTDSDSKNNAPFVCTAECTSMHEGRQLVHTILPINVDNLMALLFSESKFFCEFHKQRKTSNMIASNWILNEDGLKCRRLTFTVAVTQAIGPKTSNVSELQIMRDCSVPGQLYSIDVTSTNAGIPYADSFNIQFHYCLIRTVDDHTMLSVYAQIKYTKSVWGIVKGFIDKNIWCGLEDFYKALLNALQSEYCTPPAKSKSRRTKRALSQKSSIEEVATKPIVKVSTSNGPPIQTSETINGNLPQEITVVETTARTSLPSNQNLDLFSVFVMAVLIALVLLNIFLLIQLCVLEGSSSSTDNSDNRIQLNDILVSSFSDTNNLRENWLKILKEQKLVHATELAKWQSFVKTTIESLDKVKSRYTQFSIDLEKYVNDLNDEF